MLLAGPGPAGQIAIHLALPGRRWTVCAVEVAELQPAEPSRKRWLYAWCQRCWDRPVGAELAEPWRALASHALDEILSSEDLYTVGRALAVIEERLLVLLPELGA